MSNTSLWRDSHGNQFYPAGSSDYYICRFYPNPDLYQKLVSELTPDKVRTIEVANVNIENESGAPLKGVWVELYG